MARTPNKVTARAVDEVTAHARRARHADDRAASEWAATYDAIIRLSASREITIAAAAELLDVSEPTLNRALAARRRAASEAT